jgi:hypothetical protein
VIGSITARVIAMYPMAPTHRPPKIASAGIIHHDSPSEAHPLEGAATNTTAITTAAAKLQTRLTIRLIVKATPEKTRGQEEAISR